MSLLADNFKSGSPFMHHDFTKTTFSLFNRLKKDPFRSKSYHILLALSATPAITTRTTLTRY
jgi:hypothetical protein